MTHLPPAPAQPGISMMASSSGQRYRDYRRQRRTNTTESRGGGPAEDRKRKPRGFGLLLWEFLRLLRGHGWAIGFALATLTLATLLRLAPPLATKLVVDNVLIDPLIRGFSAGASNARRLS